MRCGTKVRSGISYGRKARKFSEDPSTLHVNPLLLAAILKLKIQNGRHIEQIERVSQSTHR